MAFFRATGAGFGDGCRDVTFSLVVGLSGAVTLLSGTGAKPDELIAGGGVGAGASFGGVLRLGSAVAGRDGGVRSLTWDIEVGCEGSCRLV